MAENFVDAYHGSQLLSSLAAMMGLPTDLVNFFAAQVAALFLATLFRKPLRYAPPAFRHSLCLLIGLYMGYFCFGQQAVHLTILPMLCYLVLQNVPHRIMGNVTLTVSILYLSCMQIHKQLYHMKNLSLDITGPLMVITQRVTSLAYSVQDELTRENGGGGGGKVGTLMTGSNNNLTKLGRIPGPLAYFAFTLAFQTIMCGPVIFYPDYIHFIEGHLAQQEVKEKHVTPSPRRAVMHKVLGSFTAAVIHLVLMHKYPKSLLEDLSDPTSEVSVSWSAMYVMWYAYLATLIERCKYYHAWLLSEAICNNSGLGFNGYDADSGEPRWDKMTNIDIFGFEFSQNFRDAIASWNKNTNTWLRHVAYVRGSEAWRTTRVYALSAVWHGFHPGYYLTFSVGGLFTVAARRVRTVVRPMFMDNGPRKKLYDLMSFVTTRVALTYATVPFVLLRLEPSLAFYGKLYYSLHLIALGTLLLPVKRGASTSTPASVNSVQTTPSKQSENIPQDDTAGSNRHT